MFCRAPELTCSSNKEQLLENNVLIAAHRALRNCFSGEVSARSAAAGGA